MINLFSPFQLGAVKLQHRIVMGPMTRGRADQPDGIVNDMMVEYYFQRASEGGFVVTEGTCVSPSARGWYGAPNLYSDAHVDRWRRVTDAVHGKGGVIFCQLWHTGRSSHVTVSGVQPVSASVNCSYWLDPHIVTSTPDGWVSPSPHRALDRSEIEAVVADYRAAAARARAAGFDGVELHGANGYLIDQFLQDGSNQRTDDYGGSVENRARFLLEVVEAMTEAFGGDRVGVRIGPSGRWNGMFDTNPQALFDYVAYALNRFGLAYLHIIEPRVNGSVLVAEGQASIAAARLRKVFRGPIVTAGGYDPALARVVVENGDADLVAFARSYLSNPDLPIRIASGLPLAPYDRATFYTSEARGYTDYPAYGDAAVATSKDGGAPRLYETQTVRIAAPGAAVWDLISDFADMTWMPAVKASSATNGNEPGSVRVLDFGGPQLTETLVNYDADQRTYTYKIDESAANRATAPVADVVATLSVTTINALESAAMWEASFRRLDPSERPASGADDATAQRQIAATLDLGLSALKTKAEAGGKPAQSEKDQVTP